MKKHLRLTALLASLLLSLAWFTGCGSKTQPDGTPQADTTAARADKTVHIGILQLVEHPALDAAREGFVEGLKEAGFVEGENLTIDYQNAQNEQANCQTIAGNLQPTIWIWYWPLPRRQPKPLPTLLPTRLS